MRPFAHRRLRRSVESYVDGELPVDERLVVARHLSVCWECSVAAETLRLIKHALRQRRAKIPMFASRRLYRFAEELAEGRR